MNCPSCESQNVFQPGYEGSVIAVDDKILHKCGSCSHEWALSIDKDAKQTYFRRSGRLPICSKCNDTKHVTTSSKLIYPALYVCAACNVEW